MKIEALETISLSELKPASHRKGTADVDHYLKRFEDCIDNYDATFPFSILHYAFIFRRFDVVYMIKEALTYEEWEEALQLEGPEGYEWITPLDGIYSIYTDMTPKKEHTLQKNSKR